MSKGTVRVTVLIDGKTALEGEAKIESIDDTEAELILQDERGWDKIVQVQTTTLPTDLVKQWKQDNE